MRILKRRPRKKAGRSVQRCHCLFDNRDYAAKSQALIDEGFSATDIIIDVMMNDDCPLNTIMRLYHQSNDKDMFAFSLATVLTSIEFDIHWSILRKKSNEH